MKKYYTIGIFAILSGHLNAQEISGLSLAKEISEQYSIQRSKSFCSEVLQYRIVEQSDKIVEFNAYQGIYAEIDYTNGVEVSIWDKVYYAAPTTIMRSNQYYNGENLTKVLEIIEHKYRYYENKNSWVNNLSLILNKSAIIDVHTPLNPQVLDCFYYTVQKCNEDIILNFTSKESAFPYLRFVGSGSITYNKAKNIIKKIAINMGYMDYYGSHMNTKQVLPSIITQRIEVEFANSNGFLYPKYIEYLVDWDWLVKPTKKPVYGVLPVRPNSDTEKLIMIERVELINYIQLDDRKKEAIKTFGVMEYVTSNSFACYLAPFIPAKWENVKFRGVDMIKVNNDLKIDGKTLYEQAQKNGMKNMKPHDKIEYENYIRNAHKTCKERLYPLLFNRIY